MTSLEEKTIRFSGVEGFQDVFFDQIGEIIPISDNWEINRLLETIWEIVRNIHDHNHGWGYLKIEKTGNGCIRFEVGNFQIPKAEKEKLSSQERRHVSGGAGLGRDGKEGKIVAYAKSIGIELEIDIPDGYVFRGVYRKKL